MHAYDLYNRALRAYFAAANRHGHIYKQPSETCSGIETTNGRSYMVLRNNYRALAVYRLRNGGTLRRLTRWPKSLENW